MFIKQSSRKDILWKKIRNNMRASSSSLLLLLLGLLISTVLILSLILRLTETRKSKLQRILSPIIVIPHKTGAKEKGWGPLYNENGVEMKYSSLLEKYEKYENYETTYSDILHDKETPHGMAFDFILNKDKHVYEDGGDESHIIQRFVLTLIFFAMGGKDTNDEGIGWDSSKANFLTDLHECQWSSIEDESAGIWYTDTSMMGVMCNENADVVQLRLAHLVDHIHFNLDYDGPDGFIPEEIKWLKNLESFDVDSSKLSGPIPQTLGELVKLRNLTLSGNSFTGTIPDVFGNLHSLERVYLNFNYSLSYYYSSPDPGMSMYSSPDPGIPSSLCTLREKGALTDLWIDCGYGNECTCCTVCCGRLMECLPNGTHW